MKLGNETHFSVLKTAEEAENFWSPRQKMVRQMRVEKCKQILSGDAQVVSFFFILET